MNSNIDHLYYINLDKRTDRNEHVLSNVLPAFKACEGEYTRMSATDTTGHGTAGKRASGCTLSHISVYDHAKQNGFKYVIVLEDDFKPTLNSLEIDLRISRLFQNHKNFDVCQVAFNERYGCTYPVCDLLMRGENIQTTCGYIINVDFCDVLLPVFQERVERLMSGSRPQLWACDQVWKKFQSKDSWFLTRCGKQLDDFSDIEGRKVAYNC